MIGLPVTKWLAAPLLAGAIATLVVMEMSASASPGSGPTQSGRDLAHTLGGPSAAAASCVGLTRAEQQAAARVIVIGQMEPGPGALIQHRQVLLSPARMRAGRYLKGSGPRTAEVQTAARRRTGQIEISEDGILPSAGQRWEILSSSARMPFQTSTCLGSRRLPDRRSPR